MLCSFLQPVAHTATSTPPTCVNKHTRCFTRCFTMADFANLLSDLEQNGAPQEADADYSAPPASADPSYSYQKVQHFWSTEVGTPTLLPYPFAFLPKVQETLQEQGEVISHLKANIKSLPDSITLSILEGEYERVKYIVTDLLRCRLKKIERHPFFYGEVARGESGGQDDGEGEDDEGEGASKEATPSLYYFSQPELTFALGFEALIKAHFEASVLKNMTHKLTEMRRLDKPEMIDAPDLDAYVFAKRVGGNEDMDEERTLENTVCIVRFEIVKAEVERGEWIVLP